MYTLNNSCMIFLLLVVCCFSKPIHEGQQHETNTLNLQVPTQLEKNNQLVNAVSGGESIQENETKEELDLMDDEDSFSYLRTLVTQRIIGGSDAKKKDYQYMALVAEREHHHEYLLCGGTLVAPNAVLTLTDCVDDYDKIVVMIKGKSKYNYFQKRHKVRKIKRHSSGLALLFFRNPSDVEPATMYTKGVNSGTGSILGWGDSVQNPYSHGCDYDFYQCKEELQEAKIKIASMKKCANRETWGNSIGDFFCGGQNGRHGDSCDADPGGPFILDGKLYGVIFEQQCSKKGYRLYIKISKHYSWIVGTINEYNAEPKYLLYGAGKCRTDAPGVEEEGIFRKVCNPQRGTGCPHQTCEDKCEKNEACLFYEYWTGKNRRKGTCKLHYHAINNLKDEEGIGCYQKGDPGLLCNYKPVGVGYCEKANGEFGLFETVCSRSKTLCTLSDCQERCENRNDCFGVEFWNNKGRHTGTCKIMLEEVTGGNGNPSSICYTKSDPC